MKVNHSLGKEGAKHKLEKFADQLKAQFPADANHIHQTWTGDSCAVHGKIKGFSINCDVAIEEDSATVTGSIPFLARPFSGAIESAVKQGLEKALRS